MDTTHCATYTFKVETNKNFVSIIGQEAFVALPDKVCLASIGPETSKALREFTSAKFVEASEYTIPGLVDLLLECMA